MNKEFIPYEQALALKELGFDEECFGAYHNENNLDLWSGEFDYSYAVKAPLYQQAFRWFREKYKLSGTPQYFTGGYYCYTINDMKDTEKSNRLFTEFETYEEGEIACLLKLINICKKK